MDSVIKKLGRIYQALSIGFLIVLLASVFIQILMRNLLSLGSIRLEELSRYSLVSLIYLMIPVIAIHDEHIRVDLLLMRFGRKARLASHQIIQLLTVSFCLAFLIAVYQIMRRNWNVITPALRMPNFIFYLPVVLGFLFFILAGINLFLKYLRGEEVAPPLGVGQTAGQESGNEERANR